MKMKQIDEEAYGEPETDKELMYREVKTPKIKVGFVRDS